VNVRRLQFRGVTRGSEEGSGVADPRNGDDPLDVSLEDTELLAEVGLLTDLIVAAQEADEPLSVEEVDRLLGLCP
jgi:hypothetical protein